MEIYDIVACRTAKVATYFVKIGGRALYFVKNFEKCTLVAGHFILNQIFKNVEIGQIRITAADPYSCTGPCPQLPCTFGALALNLENQNYRQRLDEIQNLLEIRVQLSEYYNFGRIEPGRHGCFFGLENGHLRPQIIIFSRCAALVKAAPYGARGNLHSLTWVGGGAPKTPIFIGKNESNSELHCLRPLRRP